MSTPPRPQEEAAAAWQRCHRKLEMAAACERKHPNERFLCHHLRNAASLCILSSLCPSEIDAIAALCSSSGTEMKRKQCREAQRNLDSCMISHQHDPDLS